MHFTIINLCAKLLINNKLTIAFAESITAGRLTYDFSTIDNSVAFLKGGIICFSNETKDQLLNIPAELTKNVNYYSLEATEDMARGLARIIPTANIHVGVNGSNLSGDSEGIGDQTGTIYICALLNSEILFSREFKFDGTKEDIINQTIIHVAYFLRHYLENKQIQLNYTA